jgi:hypothetical protein
MIMEEFGEGEVGNLVGCLWNTNALWSLSRQNSIVNISHITIATELIES